MKREGERFEEYCIGPHLFRRFPSGNLHRQDNETGEWHEVVFDGE